MLISEVIRRLIQIYVRHGDMKLVIRTTNELGNCEIECIVPSPGKTLSTIISRSEYITERE